MTHFEIRQFIASDGYPLHYRLWRHPGKRRAGYIVALHGIQSHSGWYEYSSQRLCHAGYEVCFVDRRGAGLNWGRRGDAPHYRRLINDVIQFLDDVRHRRDEEAPEAAVILLGVSWGGKLAAIIGAERPELVDGLALLYPGICSRIHPNWYQRLQLRLAEVLGIRRQAVPIPLQDPALFTSEAKWREYIRCDPLALHEVTVSFLLANRELDGMAAEAPPKLHCPVLMMLAGRDQIVDNAATCAYFERMASPKRTLVEYPEAQHTLEFESRRDRFVADLLDWLNDHSTLASTVRAGGQYG